MAAVAIDFPAGKLRSVYVTDQRSEKGAANEKFVKNFPSELTIMLTLTEKSREYKGLVAIAFLCGTAFPDHLIPEKQYHSVSADEARQNHEATLTLSIIVETKWYYDWRSSKHINSMKHELRVLALEQKNGGAPAGALLAATHRVVGIAKSAHFELRSRRGEEELKKKLDKRHAAAAAAAAAVGVGAVATRVEEVTDFDQLNSQLLVNQDFDHDREALHGWLGVTVA